jgi:hypothetical protein
MPIYAGQIARKSRIIAQVAESCHAGFPAAAVTTSSLRVGGSKRAGGKSCPALEDTPETPGLGVAQSLGDLLDRRIRLGQQRQRALLDEAQPDLAKRRSLGFQSALQGPRADGEQSGSDVFGYGAVRTGDVKDLKNGIFHCLDRRYAHESPQLGQRHHPLRLRRAGVECREIG